MSVLLVSLLSSFLLFSLTSGSPGSCLADWQQKKTASAEPGLTKCQQYASHSCCSQDQIDPPFPWDGCGPPSPRCEEYLSRVQCMYLCSPHIAKWGHPKTVAGVHELPLCNKFCDDWFDACREDLICSGCITSVKNCSKGCITYAQKFGSGQQLCDTVWKHTFVAMTEDCICITPPEKGLGLEQNPTHADLDSTQEGSSGYPEKCYPHKVSHNRVRRALRKRSVQIEVDGSGSGNGA
ncbi:retbindin [Pseudophryne corroboree]|uniref:retbindin n=1 Tax=Pseudophryne corroboree TaxID=495146 RepID=UPI003081E580